MVFVLRDNHVIVLAPQTTLFRVVRKTLLDMDAKLE